MSAALGLTVCVHTQGACRTAGVAANVEVAVRRVQEAADAGAKIVVFPELFLSGYLLVWASVGVSVVFR